jgi:serine/threonine-protein kinase
MEFVDGESLSDLLQKKRFTSQEVIDFGVAVAETLDHAHRKGIVHRDIKPSNILLRSDGRWKITDFGIAHIEDTAAPELTQAGEILGTPAYMSPEQVSSRPVDGRSDIFSLGIILYEMATGTRPFRGPSLSAIFNAICTEEPVDPVKVNHETGRELSEVITRCIRKKPEERFDSGIALAEALRRCGAPREDAVKPPREKAEPPAKKPAKRIGIAAAAVAGVVIAALVVYYAVGTRVPSQQVEPPAKKEPQAPSSTTPKGDEKTRRGTLVVESRPIGAQVFVDGAYQGKTPAKVDLDVGKHEVRVSLRNHNDWEAQVELTGEGETPLNVTLTPSTPEAASPVPGVKASGRQPSPARPQAEPSGPASSSAAPAAQEPRPGTARTPPDPAVERDLAEAQRSFDRRQYDVAISKAEAVLQRDEANRRAKEILESARAERRKVMESWKQQLEEAPVSGGRRQ